MQIARVSKTYLLLFLGVCSEISKFWPFSNVKTAQTFAKVEPISHNYVEEENCHVYKSFIQRHEGNENLKKVESSNHWSFSNVKIAQTFAKVEPISHNYVEENCQVNKTFIQRQEGNENLKKVEISNLWSFSNVKTAQTFAKVKPIRY
jgi:hypothetical protein